MLLKAYLPTHSRDSFNTVLNGVAANLDKLINCNLNHHDIKKRTGIFVIFEGMEGRKMVLFAFKSAGSETYAQPYKAIQLSYVSLVVFALLETSSSFTHTARSHDLQFLHSLCTSPKNAKSIAENPIALCV